VTVRLPLAPAKCAVAFPTAEHHHPLANTARLERCMCMNNLPKVVG